MEFSIRKFDNFIFNEAQGFNVQEFAKFIYDNHCEWQGKNLIWDLDDVSYDDIASQHMNALCNELHNYFLTRSGSKTALVATREISYGFMRMFEILSEKNRIEDLAVFRDIHRAIRWLEENRFEV